MNIGDRVTHKTFGRGTVIDNSRASVVRVSFDQAGEKVIDIAWLDSLSAQDDSHAQENDEVYYAETFAAADGDENHVHSDHFKAVGLDAGDIIKNLPVVMNESKIFSVTGNNFPFYFLPDDEPKGTALIWPAFRQGVVSIIRHANSGGKNMNLYRYSRWLAMGVSTRF